MATSVGPMAGMRSWTAHLRNREMRYAFGIGFLVLFVFIGTFTYVNFQLVAPPLSLSPMALGLPVYFGFLPSMLTTPFAGLSRDVSDHETALPSRLRLPLRACWLLLPELDRGAGRHGADRGRHLPGAGDRDRPCRADRGA